MDDLIRRDQVMDCINELWRRGEFTPENVAMSINALCDVDAVILPCKIGDTVWVVFSNGIRPYVVDRIYIMGNSEIMVRMRFMLNEILRLTGGNFGKTVFLTREEAEAALAKMGGDRKCTP